jgi:hypothetical protein
VPACAADGDGETKPRYGRVFDGAAEAVHASPAEDRGEYEKHSGPEMP